jgi:hypothetical protein
MRAIFMGTNAKALLSTGPRRQGCDSPDGGPTDAPRTRIMGRLLGRGKPYGERVSGRAAS